MTGISSTKRGGLIDSPSLVPRHAQSEPNLHKQEPIFIPSTSALLPSGSSGATQSSPRTIDYQLGTKPKNSTSEETHSEISTFSPSDWEGGTTGGVFDNDEDLHFLVANYFSRLGHKDILQERYSEFIEEQTMLLEEQKMRAGVDLVLSYEEQEWLKNFPVSKQNLLEELQEVGAEADALESQCFVLGLIDGHGNLIELAPIQNLVEDQTPDEEIYGTIDTDILISQWLSPGDFLSKTTRTRSPKTFNHKRKVVRVFLNGEECIACPDSGSDRDIMSEAFAEQHGFNIRRTETDKEWFKMGNGKTCRSIGRVRVSCTLLEDQKHLLTDYPSEFMVMPTLKLIGSPQSWISFAADGNFLTGSADTGSDLEFMSFHCAIERGFKIDTRESARTCVMLPDCTTVETMGIVHITSFEIAVFDGSRMTYQVLPRLPNGLCEDLEMGFHVLPDMPCDVIFGEEFLELKDAFNTCSQIIHLRDPSSQNLNILINLGKVQAFLGRKLKKNSSTTASQDHDDQVNAEICRRCKVRRIISKREDGEEAVAAEKSEADKVKAFDEAHAKCVHCVGEKTKGPATIAADKVLDDTPRWSREF